MNFDDSTSDSSSDVLRHFSSGAAAGSGHAFHPVNTLVLEEDVVRDGGEAPVVHTARHFLPPSRTVMRSDTDESDSAGSISKESVGSTGAERPHARHGKLLATTDAGSHLASVLSSADADRVLIKPPVSKMKAFVAISSSDEDSPSSEKERRPPSVGTSTSRGEAGSGSGAARGPRFYSRDSDSGSTVYDNDAFGSSGGEVDRPRMNQAMELSSLGDEGDDDDLSSVSEQVQSAIEAAELQQMMTPTPSTTVTFDGVATGQTALTTFATNDETHAKDGAEHLGEEVRAARTGRDLSSNSESNKSGSSSSTPMRSVPLMPGILPRPVTAQADSRAGTRGDVNVLGKPDHTVVNLPIKEVSELDDRLAAMELVDVTPLSATYVQPADEAASMVKVLSLFQCASNAGWRGERHALQQKVKRIAAHMLDTQRRLEEAQLVAALPRGDPDSLAEGEEDDRVCSGIVSVDVDAACRIAVTLSPEPYSVCLHDVTAFLEEPISHSGHVALLRSLVWGVAEMHRAGVVHGALHGGNVLFSLSDGHCILTQPAGLATTSPALPSDASFLSPALATAMREVVERVWSHEVAAQPGRIGESPAMDPEEKLALHIAELFHADGRCITLTMARPCDDVYAIGMLAFTLYVGVPVLHGFTLKEAVIALADHSDDTEHMKMRVTGLLRSRFVQSRCFRARYSETFMRLMESFITDCVAAGASRDESGDGKGPYQDADALLSHPLLTHFPPDRGMVDARNVEADEECDMIATRDASHRLVYAISRYSNRCRELCGSAPYIPRLHRNSVLSSRAAQLHASVREEKRPQSSDHNTAAAALVSPATGAAPTEREALNHDDFEAASGCAVSLPMRCIIFEGKSNALLSLQRESLGLFTTQVDTLLLRDIEVCRVEILASFKHVVLVNVRQCEVLLGPASVCYAHNVHNCETLAVAAAQVLLGDVSNVTLCYPGIAPPVFLGAEAAMAGLQLRPYSVAYPGLTADYARACVPLECSGTLQVFLAQQQQQEEEHGQLQCSAQRATASHASGLEGDGVSESGGSWQPVQRTFRLLGLERQGHDFAYAESLIKCGSHFIHRGDSESDCYFYYGELHNKDVTIADIHGPNGGVGVWSEKPAIYAALKELKQQRQPGDKVAQTPTIFILDVVEDVVIERCSHCRIFVFGSTSNLVVRDCHNIALCFLAKESAIYNSTDINVWALVTAYFELTECKRVNVFPLYLQCPYTDAILRALHAEAVENGDASVLTAFEDFDMNLLNIVLRGHGRPGPILTNCSDIAVHDAEWYGLHPETPPDLITVAIPVLDEYTSGTENESGEDQNLTASNFVEECCATMGVSSNSDWFHRCPFPTACPIPGNTASTADRGGGTLVRLHDLVDIAILRLEEALCAGAAALSQDGNETELCDLVLDRIAGGYVHIEDAVGTLFIHDCTGPLDVTVAAATHVVLANCQQVTLRVACSDFAAQDCLHCHTALHSNTPPVYLRCSDMLTSALNLTSRHFAEALRRASVDIHSNSFHTAQLAPVSLPHALCRVSQAEMVPIQSTDDDDGDSEGGQSYAPTPTPVNSVSQALTVLHRPVTVVAPLEGCCLGSEEAAFCPEMESVVNREAKRRSDIVYTLAASLSYLAATPSSGAGGASPHVSAAASQPSATIVTRSQGIAFPTALMFSSEDDNNDSDDHEVRSGAGEEKGGNTGREADMASVTMEVDSSSHDEANPSATSVTATSASSAVQMPGVPLGRNVVDVISPPMNAAEVSKSCEGSDDGYVRTPSTSKRLPPPPPTPPENESTKERDDDHESEEAGTDDDYSKDIEDDGEEKEVPGPVGPARLQRHVDPHEGTAEEEEEVGEEKLGGAPPPPSRELPPPTPDRVDVNVSIGDTRQCDGGDDERAPHGGEPPTALGSTSLELPTEGGSELSGRLESTTTSPAPSTGGSTARHEGTSSEMKIRRRVLERQEEMWRNALSADTQATAHSHLFMIQPSSHVPLNYVRREPDGVETPSRWQRDDEVADTLAATYGSAEQPELLRAPHDGPLSTSMPRQLPSSHSVLDSSLTRSATYYHHKMQSQPCAVPATFLYLKDEEDEDGRDANYLAASLVNTEAARTTTPTATALFKAEEDGEVAPATRLEEGQTNAAGPVADGGVMTGLLARLEVARRAYKEAAPEREKMTMRVAAAIEFLNSI